MSLNRYAKKRDANEPEIVKAFRQVGADVYPLDTPCDLIVGYRGHNYLVEVKTQKGKLTKDQQEFQDTWRGQKIFIIRSTQEAIDFINNPGIRQRRDAA